MKKALEIINKNKHRNMDGFVYDHDKSVKEIHKHYLQFTDWMMKGTIMPDPDDSSKYWDCLPMVGEVSWTLDEVYSYYCKKVLNQ